MSNNSALGFMFEYSLVMLLSEYVDADLCSREAGGWGRDMISTLEIIL
jgi:hypothetical protein